MEGEELRGMLEDIQQQLWDFSAHLARMFFSYS
jgi:cob(I)alamin adenosyltransferase